MFQFILPQDFTNSNREIFDTYFGGVTLFPIDLFKKVNGYSNEYWGWGFEDDDLLMRLTEQHIFTDTIYYEVPKLNTSGLYLHGDQSYISVHNTIQLNNDFTIHISFKPDDIIPIITKCLMNIVYLVLRVGIPQSHIILSIDINLNIGILEKIVNK